jgi:CBS domain containing-hemolysin-like protein
MPATVDWTQLAASTGLILVLLAMSAAFSASEAVLFSLSRVQLERAAASASVLRRRAAQLMARPKSTLLTILIANTAVNVALFAEAYVLFSRLGYRLGAWAVPLAGVASVLLVVVVGEVVPKVLGVSVADRLAPLSAVVVHTVGFVARPLGRIIDLVLAEPFVRIVLGPERSRSAADLSADELKTLLAMSRQGGTLRPLEDTFLRPIVDLSSMRVVDVMVPRVAMKAYDVRASSEGLRALMRESRHKKIPVYDGSLDNMVGLVYAKVLFLNPGKTLRELVVPVRFVPALITCEQLLIHFRSTRSQVAIVVDEYGGVAGLVTLEDVIEQIVGELHDPEEQPAEPEIQALPEGGYEISGQLSVQYWIEAFGLPQRVERVATVGGLVMAQLGRPAVVGDRVQFGNVELQVVRVRSRRIERLHLRLRPAAGEPEGGAT